MAAALLLHLGDGELRDVKEAGDVDTKDRRVVGLGVLGKRFGDEDAGVVVNLLYASTGLLERAPIGPRGADWFEDAPSEREEYSLFGRHSSAA